MLARNSQGVDCWHVSRPDLAPIPADARDAIDLAVVRASIELFFLKQSVRKRSSWLACFTAKKVARLVCASGLRVVSHMQETLAEACVKNASWTAGILDSNHNQ